MGGGVCHPHVPTDRPPSIADFDPGLLDRYLAGRAGSAEAAGIDAVLAADPTLAREVAALRVALTAGLPRAADATALARRAQAIREQVDADGGVPRSRGARPHTRTVGARAARPQSLLAAMVVMAVGIGLAVSSVRRHAAVASRGHTYATAPGQRLSVTLVDGTQVMLAPASTVRIAADYGRGSGSRDVALEGEAYFTVVHDAGLPFAVRTRGAVAHDVGTAFDVRAYPEDAEAMIVVAEGAVAITTAGSYRTSARAGDVATVGGGEVAINHRGDVSAYVAWMQGGLVFEDTPLRKVVRDVARTFGVAVTVADSGLLGRRITANFADQPLDVVLDEVTRAVGARYERTARGIVILGGIAGRRGRDEDARPPLTTARATGARE